MDRYSDGWKELNTTLQSIQKKLLKKPNYNEALDSLRKISIQMLDFEMPDHAALCHTEMASIYAKMGNNTIVERENWLKSADLYSNAYRRQKNNCITVDSHLLIEMESSYLHALENCTKNNCTYLSGTILLEMAIHLFEFENFPLAFEYFQKAARFLQNEIYQQKIILDHMCFCIRRMNNFDEALFDTTLMFTNLTKTETFMSPIREKLLEVELKLVLLHLLQFIDDNRIRPKSLLLIYSTQQPNRPSVAVRDEFQPINSFIEAFRERDTLKIHSIYQKDLHHRMDTFSRQLAKELISKLSSSQTKTQPELKEILEDSSIDELERRKRMFEWYQTSARKNRPTFENL